MGLFALVACSEDAYQEADEVNSSIVESNNQSNVKTPFTVTSGYSSPWDQYSRAIIPKKVSYVLANTTSQVNPAKRLIFRVTPYIGLAYYDDVPNGIYTDLETGLNVANMMTPPYSNLYAGGKEVGNFIAGYPLTLTGVGGVGTTEQDMSILSDTYHCPVLDGNDGVSNAGRYFNIPPSNATSAERWLLANYGKVFFYYWEAIDTTSLAVVQSGYIKHSCDESIVTGATPILTPAGAFLNVTIPNLPPAPTSSRLFAHHSLPPLIPVVPPTPPYPAPNYPRSMEVTLQERVYPSVVTFSYNGNDYIVECIVYPTGLWLLFDSL